MAFHVPCWLYHVTDGARLFLDQAELDAAAIDPDWVDNPGKLPGAPIQAAPQVPPHANTTPEAPKTGKKKQWFNKPGPVN